MGKDIHIVMEIKKENNWIYIEDMIETFDCRSYSLFSILEENFGCRGLPEELEGIKVRLVEDNYYDFDATSSDLFHHSYVTLEELEIYYKKMNKVFVSEEFMDLFLSLGGVLPKGMSFDSSKDGVYVEPLDEDEIHFQEFFKYGIDEIKELANKHNVSSDKIRMVFAFDW